MNKNPKINTAERERHAEVPSDRLTERAQLLPIARKFSLGTNAGITLPTLKSAIEFVEECDRKVGPRAVFRRSPKARTVRFLKELSFIISDDEPPSLPNEQFSTRAQKPRDRQSKNFCKQQ